MTQLIASLEYLTRESDRGPGGVNHWATTRNVFVRMPTGVRRVLDVVSAPGVTRALHIGRATAAAALWLPLPRRTRAVADAALAGTQVLLYPRQLFGTDGADQVSFLVQSLSAVARAGERRPRVVDACLWAVALQSVMSYTVSGFAKFPSRTWRSGEALPGVTRTLTYGDRGTWAFLTRHPRLSRALAHGVLALEAGFPAVFLRGGRLAPWLCGSMGAFHLVNARVMGLGRFFWAFSSTYPAVLYATGPRTRSVRGGPAERRSDAVPVAFGALAVAGFGAAQVRRRRGERLVDRGLGGERRLVTSSGGTLVYRWAGTAVPAGNRDEPVLVLENGLGTSSAHWAWLVRELGWQGGVVTYQRAGYGPSRARHGAEFSPGGAAADLAELAEHVADGRPVVLVGHSLGGYLAMLAAERLGDRVRAMVLVDTSHPGELRRSPGQARGAALLTQGGLLLPQSLRAGLGPLLEPPPWLGQLPHDIRPFAEAHYRDARTWRAARREWRAVEREFGAFDGTEPKVAVPALVVTAGRTAEEQPVHAELHRELAASAPFGEVHLIEGADHHGVLADRRHAGAVAGLITEFLAEVAGNARMP
ncbi:alpha/beta fold hydrolase [Streptomyces sp. NPDC052396]|uniref:alpha/beta fold hydrolase n=1 Tax=Streptomyces sp. NPDC052396 TaxID=3365689 RepID=UPI0037D7B6F1